MKRLLLLTITAIFTLFTTANAQEIAGNGLHTQPWIMESFLEFSDDLEEAAAEGKDLMIIVEQAGCPYCRELHQVNFKRDEITDYIKENYVVVQLDLFGARSTVDFDGQELEERDLVMKWGAFFTPTTIIFTADKAGAENFKQAEAFRLPGYLKPFHYMASLEFVATDAYQETDFQRFLGEKIQLLTEKGISPDVW